MTSTRLRGHTGDNMGCTSLEAAPSGVFALSEGCFWMKEGPDALPGPPPWSHRREAVAFALPLPVEQMPPLWREPSAGAWGKCRPEAQGQFVAVTPGLALTGREPSANHPTPPALVSLSANPGQEDGTCLAQG